MKTVTTTDAKARLNALLAEVAAGETITSHGRAVAVLSTAEQTSRRFGTLAGAVTLTDDFDAPMSEDDLALWGESAWPPLLGARCCSTRAPSSI